MDIVDNISSLQASIEQQKQLMADLEKQFHDLADSDIYTENHRLLDEHKNMNERLAQLEQKYIFLKEENRALKNRVFEYAYSEKTMLVSNAATRAGSYFGSAEKQQVNRLTALENATKQRLDHLKRSFASYDTELEDKIYSRIDSLAKELSDEINQTKNSRSKTMEHMAAQSNGDFDALKKEPVTDSQIAQASRQKNIESFVGLNLINKLGILLIIIGVFAASQFDFLPNQIKAAMIFVLGIAMLVGGELSSRKQSTVVSLGFISGGVAVLYTGLGISFFNLEILSMPVALILCILITFVSFLLSVRYNSQVVASFALVGGYLPMFSILENDMLLVGSMVYFLSFHLLVLLLSSRKKWRVVSFAGLIFNIVSTVSVTSLTLESYRYTPSFGVIRHFLLLYPVLSFAIYTAVPLLSTKKDNGRFLISDVVFISINTFFSSVAMYFLLDQADLEVFHGLMAVAFGLSYFVVSKIVERFYDQERKMGALFLLTALTFVVLVVPMQFGVKWLSIGWLIEGVLLATYGILFSHKAFRRAGYIISFLCLGAFILHDIPLYHGETLLTIKYSFLTLGSLIVLGAFLYKQRPLSSGKSVFQFFTLGNLWLYMLYIIYSELYYTTFKALAYGQNRYLWTAVFVAITFLLAAVVVRLPVLRSRGTRIFSIIIYFIGSFTAFWLNCTRSLYIYDSSKNTTALLLANASVIILAIACLLAVFDLVRLLAVQKAMSPFTVPLILSGYFLIILTQNLIVHYGLSFSSIVLSISYAVMSILWIAFGFIKQRTLLRHFGLGLAIASVVKLVLIDLYALTAGYRIISYFALGMSLVLISFIYQYYDRKLESKGGSSHEEISAPSDES